MNQERCNLSDLLIDQCFHCVTGARDLVRDPTLPKGQNSDRDID